MLTRIDLPGTDRHEVPTGNETPCHPDERHEVTVRLKHNPGADPFPILSAFASEHGLSVVATYPIECRAVLSGDTYAMESAFRVKLYQREHESGGVFPAHFGPVSVPLELHEHVEGVFGLDKRPVAKPHFRKIDRLHVEKLAARIGSAIYSMNLDDGTLEADAHMHAKAAEENALKKPPGTFTPLDLAKLYGFPAATGQNQCIAILEMGGGYRTSDLTKYFAELGIAGPNVSMVSVDHAKNQPGSDADGEVMLDIEIAGAIAPHAKIVVYFTPNTDQGFLDAVSAVIHDKKNNPSVLSISWGGPESNWTPATMVAMDKLFQQAAAAGITVLVAAGDDGSNDGVDDGHNHVDFPASSPNVVACGGTKLVVNGTTLTETIWNELAGGNGAGGGGYSAQFAMPSYQEGHLPSGIKSRGVPDISGEADPVTGYNVRVDGKDNVYGGTSCVSPLYAGLAARLNQLYGKRLGFWNPTLYKTPSVCRDITSGNNGSFSAGPGWDGASGLGVIVGTSLEAAFK